MAVYQFSALSDGQAISFNPNADVLNFDQSVIAAADLRVAIEGSNIRVNVVSGPHAGKDVVLLNTTPLQLATSNISFADGSRLQFGDNTTGTANDNFNNSLTGTSGRDLLAGFGGNDTLNGGLGNDTYIATTGDVLVDSGGIDTVESAVSWTLGAGFENLTFTGTAKISGSGNNLNNVIVGSSGHNWLRGLEGNDSVFGGAGDDTINMSNGSGASYGTDYIDGGDGIDTLDYGATARTALVIDLLAGTASGGGTGGAGSATLVSIENANGSGFDDRITGNGAANFLYGYNGNDTLDGGAGNDRLEGAAGNDQYIFSAAVGAANADTIIGFASGSDKIVLANVNLGANGNFAAGDARFAAGGFNSGQDSSDRVIYNATTGQLWYDADGNGSGTAQLIATLQGAPALAATDIIAQGSTGPAPIVGTEGNDSLVGTDGNDTIDGRGGNDTIDGLVGDDSLIGGAGNDSVIGGEGVDRVSGGDGNDTLFGGEANFYEGAGDTLDGGFGDDRFVIGRYDQNVLLTDAGGVDTVVANSGWWTLATGFENLELGFDWSSDGATFGTGNAANNIITGFQAYWVDNMLDGADGNDTLIGGDGDDVFKFEAGSENYGTDFVDGRGGIDTLFFSNAPSAIVVDWHIGSLTGGGSGGSGSVTFANIEVIEGSPFADHITAPNGTGWGDYWYYYGPQVFAGAGNDTLVGGDNFDYFYGEEGDDHLSAGAGGSRLDGGAGADVLVGGASWDDIYAALGSDSVSAGGGQDYISLYTDGHDTVDGGDSTDYLYLNVLAQSAVVVDLGAGTVQGGDASGGGNATLANIEYVLTGGFDDRLTGDGAANYLEAGMGNDTLFGGAGNDTLYGGWWNDGQDDDWLDGGLGNDYMYGGSGLDRFLFTTAPGEANADWISSFTSGEDELRFDPAVYSELGASGRFSVGDERFYAASGATSGHDESDRIIYDTTNGHLYYDADGSGAGAALRIATFTWPESLQATDIHVGFGEDTSAIRGTSGNDTLIGTNGNDLIEGFGGDDSIEGLAGHDYIDAGAGADWVEGLSGNDTIHGMDGSDGIDGGSGNDSISGGAGDDDFYMVLSSSTYGQDTLDGGAGSDWITFSGIQSAGIVVDLTAGTMTGGGSSATDQAILISIENVLGTTFADWMNGDSGDNYFFGGSGDDTIDGAAGDDAVQGYAGNDFINGNAGNDFLRAEDGNDTVFGGDGSDEFVQDFNGSSPGNDVLDGGAGFDLVRYDIAMQSAVVVNLATGTASGGGASGAGTASLASIEGVLGSVFADTIRGDSSANWLSGHDGSDTIAGGNGVDTLTGGAGANSFIFDSAPNSTTNWDWINDFASGADKIRLDASVMTQLGTSDNFAAGDARFAAGAGFNSGQDASDRVIYNTSTGQLWYDADGNGAGAAQLIATLQSGAALAATDIAVDNGTTAAGQTINGTTGNDSLVGAEGNDTINGLAGNDTLIGNAGDDIFIMSTGGTASYGSDSIDGGAGADTVDFGTNGRTAIAADLASGWVQGGDDAGTGSATLLSIENFNGGAFADRITGSDADNFLFGFDGNDTLDGRGGNDRLEGAAGNDQYVFSVAPGAANADTLVGFTSGADKIVLDGNVHFDLGANGNFASGDVRFAAGAGFTSGRDATDRVIYDSTTGNLYYDSDGNGSGAAQLIATLQGAPVLAATDVDVINGSAPGGQVINGTTGNDSLVGAEGNDTINGLAGNDTLRGAGGDDSLNGGDGTDSLDGGGGNDTLLALAGHDTLLGGDGNDWLQGGGWSDTVTGGAGADSFVYAEAGTGQRDTVVDFATGTDELVFENNTLTAIGGAGAWAAGDGRYYAAAGATAGHDADDRLVYNTSTGSLYYDADGSGAGGALIIATFQGNPAIAATDITVI